LAVLTSILRFVLVQCLNVSRDATSCTKKEVPHQSRKRGRALADALP
jgi:hypothetical protein